MRTKKLNKNAMVANINGLSLGDRAFCGPYGTVTCIKSARANAHGTAPHRVYGARRFKVQNSTKIANGGNYSMAALRKAIFA